MAKLKKTFQVEIAGMSWGKKDTAKLSMSGKFECSKMEANDVQRLLAAGQLHCQLDRSGGNEQLPFKDGAAAVTKIEFDATCHRISLDLTAFSFGLSFPKTAAEASALAGFSGQNAKLCVTRTGDIADGDGDEDGDDAEEVVEDGDE